MDKEKTLRHLIKINHADQMIIRINETRTALKLPLLDKDNLADQLEKNLCLSFKPVND